MNSKLKRRIATFITALIGILVTYIKNMIVERTNYRRLKTTEQQWLTILTISSGRVGKSHQSIEVMAHEKRTKTRCA